MVSVESAHTLPVRVTSRCFLFVPSSNICSAAQTCFALPNLGKKNCPHSKPVKVFTFRTRPGAPLLQESRDSRVKAMISIQSSSPQETSLHTIRFFNFTYLTHITHSFAYLSYSPSWSFPGLTILVYWLSSYNTAVSYPHNCSTWVLQF